MTIKIGLETHVQLNSRSKIFCGCRNPVNLKDEPEPNTLLCETCLGLPGSKPRANRAVVEMALKVAVALNCAIARETFFSRKTYFYPDMSKNFQITQYEIPIAKDGHVFINAAVLGKSKLGEMTLGKKKIRIRRVHMEEDPSKIVHVGGIGGRYTLLDYNRAGIPLIEIVTEPDFSSPAEARLFLQKLASILEYLGVYDSSSRAVIKSDANVSLSGGKRVEVKNITGTKEVEQALNYEITRQRSIIKRGGKIVQATRMWNPDIGVTKEMRTKETEEDYGYIMEPDLTKIDSLDGLATRLKRGLPELPDHKQARFVKRFHLSEKIAESLVSDRDIAELFEFVAMKSSPKVAGTWIGIYLLKTLNWHGIRFRDSKLRKEWIADLIKMFEAGKLTDRNAEIAMRKMVEDRKPAREIVSEYKLEKTKLDLDKIMRETLRKNHKALEDYKSGEEKALHFLVGLVMKETMGQVDATEIRKSLLKLLK
jgi:aspartyl-tRNA(Asn)/glutamyl-tRNA(Gln) amidotransferase subunit B